MSDEAVMCWLMSDEAVMCWMMLVVSPTYPESLFLELEEDAGVVGSTLESYSFNHLMIDSNSVARIVVASCSA